MKVRSKIALRYSIITAALMLLFSFVFFFSSTKEREKEFYRDLKREGISKANLYFEADIAPDVMRTIYKNNIKYIDEVDVAIYNLSQELIYHDAGDINIVNDPPELLLKVAQTGESVSFKQDKYQALLFQFSHKNKNYIVSAAAYDGYGYAKLRGQTITLIVLTIFAILTLFLIGYYMAKRALSPISEISKKMKDIRANKLHLRLLNYNKKDEFGELASAFNDSLDIIESSFESQKLFVSNVSHELRTPLTTLLGEIDLALLKDRSKKEYKETLTNMHQDAKRLLNFFNGLLDLAKASYDESKIAMSSLRIDEILFDSRISLLKNNPTYSINLIFTQEIETEQELCVTGNNYLLKMAFSNLIDNNCKFSENKSSSIKISSYGGEIILLFSDTGKGMTEKEQKMIFTPFYRGNNETKVQGHGIGMTLVKKVIDLHKGEIKISSTSELGTTFQINLPVEN